MAPRETARVTRRYRPGTLILETCFETEEGAATLVDFMPFHDDHSEIVRLVIGTRGKMAMHTELVLRFGYGAVVPWVTRLENGALRAIAGPDMVVLRTPVHVTGKDMTTVGAFTVGRGESIPFVLTYARSHKALPQALDPTASLEATEKFWTGWSAKCRPAGEWSEAVCRSVITLKALTYGPTGGIVAAPTTSLPEKIGGERNWDYRYCWLRDATLTLLGAMNAGFYEEAQAWREWLLRTVAGSPDQIQIMYGIGGERRLAEWIVDWLPGYEKSAPVRIGNAAHVQLQLDVFGEIMDTYHQARRCGLTTNESGWDVQIKFLEHLTKIWQRAGPGHLGDARPGAAFHLFQGHGLGRFRSRHQERGDVRAARGRSTNGASCATKFSRDVCERGYDKKLGTFVQAYGSDQLDANLLLLPCVGFLPVTDPRIERTIAAIERRLVRDGFVMRYSTEEVEDALPPGEGRVPRLQLLACRRLHFAGAVRRSRSAVSAAGRSRQRCRPFERGIRTELKAPGRQFSASLFASGARSTAPII